MKRIIPLLASIVITVGLFSPAAQAQLDETPQALNAKAVNAMKQGQWKQALEYLTIATDRFDANGPTLFGPRFGTTWYNRGYCEMKLKMWKEAMESFQICYERYANSTTGGKSINVYQKRALLRHAESAQAAEKWETAVEMYKKFLAERSKTDTFNPGSLYINLAISLFKTGDLTQGRQSFETALKNRLNYGTSDVGIITAFQAMIDTLVEKGDDKALIGFITQNRGNLVIEPSDMGPYAQLFLRLASQANQAGMKHSAFALYQLLPDTKVMLDDANSRSERMAGMLNVRDGIHRFQKAELNNAVKNLKKAIDSGNPNEVIQLAATAFLHEANGNVPGAYAAYKQIEQNYPKSSRRETNLFNLVRTAVATGKTEDTEKYGRAFLAEFPKSSHLADVQRVMLNSLFYSGKYEECIKIAKPMLPQLEEKTKEHEIALHFLGASYYYTASFHEAEPLLDSFIELYPESPFAQGAYYFQASNSTRLQQWKKANSLLAAYLEKFDEEDNPYLSYALFDRATCQYVLDEFTNVLATIDRLETEFPEANILDSAFNMKGNTYLSIDDPNEEKAEEYYKKGLELAKKRGDSIVAGESLYRLVVLLGEEPKSDKAENRLADAAAYADEFWENHSKSQYSTQVAVAEMPAYRAAGRSEEALQRLQEAITQVASAPGTPGLEEAINSFTEAYLESHSAEDLKTLYYDFPGVSANNQVARALFRIALIGVFEQQLSKAADQNERIKAEAGITVLFEDLRSAFNVKDLSNFILVKVGDFIRNTNSPQEAKPYYDEALNRDNNDYMFPALLGRAALLAEGSENDKADAIKDFERILAESDDKANKDNALYRIVSTQLELKDYENTRKNARRYLTSDERFSIHKPQVGMMLAQAYEGLNLKEDALATYINVANSYTGMLSISAPATKRAMEIAWERNGVGEDGLLDHQAAYNLGRVYTDNTRRIIDSARPGENRGPTEDEIKQWKEVEALVKQYEAAPDVKSKEELEEEAKERRRRR